jgi:hypothetical protein
MPIPSRTNLWNHFPPYFKPLLCNGSYQATTRKSTVSDLKAPILATGPHDCPRHQDHPLSSSSMSLYDIWSTDLQSSSTIWKQVTEASKMKPSNPNPVDQQSQNRSITAKLEISGWIPSNDPVSSAFQSQPIPTQEVNAHPYR